MNFFTSSCQNFLNTLDSHSLLLTWAELGQSQLLFDAPIGIFFRTWQGQIVQANPAFCQWLGYSQEELQQLDYQTISLPADFETEVQILQQLRKQRSGKSSLQKRFLRSDGSWLWAELTLRLVPSPETADPLILTFVQDLSQQQQAEQEIQERRAREALLSEISAQIRSSPELLKILDFATERLRQALQTDRVLVYQLHPDQSGACIAESVSPGYGAMKGQIFPADCIPPPYLESYRLGKLWSTSNVCSETLTDCHLQMLDQVQVKSMMAIAIQRHEEVEPQERSLWGLLVVHHCRATRVWNNDDQQLFQALANQIAIAIEQTSLIRQLQQYTQDLEARVQQRTASLSRLLKFEQLIRRLTETLRQVVEEDQVLQIAVEGLVETLGVEACYASLLHPEQQQLEVRCEHWQGRQKNLLVGYSFNFSDFPPIYLQPLLQGQTIHRTVHLSHLLQQWQGGAFREIPADLLQQNQSLFASPLVQVICPILDNQGLLGGLSLICDPTRYLDADELKLIEQVANQCAIAIRQSYLYREEHQQRMSAEHFRMFLNQSTDVFVEYDRNLRYLSINQSGCQLLARPATEIIGKTNQEILGPAAIGIEALIRQALISQEPVFIDHEISFPDGIRVFETIYTPIPDPTGTVQRIIGVCREITEFKQQWQQLEHQNYQLAETSRLKEEFIATTSHELRTPLTAILGFSNILLQEFFGPLNSKQQDYVDRIHSSGQHLLALINDILDLSRLEANRLELDLQPVSIKDLCDSVLGLIGERAEIQGLEIKVEMNLPENYILFADPRRLRQMLINLLSNAVKFTLKGEVGLSVSLSSSLPSGTPWIHFKVWDTGVGIQATDQPLLFSPFSQVDSSLSRKHQGTGLGLAITQKLAELHGGSISFESQPGKGSCFTLTLPVC